jgi:hypothetical protein
MITKELNDFLGVLRSQQTYPLAKVFSRVLLRILHQLFYEGDIPDNVSNLLQN